MAIIKEYEELTAARLDLKDKEFNQLKDFAIENQYDKQGNFRPVLQLRNGKLFAQNYVGIITTKKGTVLEILPKVDLGTEDDNEQTKKIFLDMLRTWRGLSDAQFGYSKISAIRRFNMLEAFVRLFLDNLVSLTRRGLARHYLPVEDNLTCLKGRLQFPQHLRINIANRAKFYVKYDEFSADRPANRLIRSAIHELMSVVRQPENQQLLYQLRLCFDEIPLLTQKQQWKNDWDKHRIDRSMPHYDPVMPWVRLFLFQHGLTTFKGKHVNQSLLFPMEEVFEDFVTHHFRKHQNKFSVKSQGPLKPLAHLDNLDGKGAFYMKPDISLMLSRNEVTYILDAKWKRIYGQANDPKRDISQSDVYQLYSYGKKYNCKKVALIYPRTDKFNKHFHYHFDRELSLYCFPFEVANPEESVKEIMRNLCPPQYSN